MTKKYDLPRKQVDYLFEQLTLPIAEIDYEGVNEAIGVLAKVVGKTLKAESAEVKASKPKKTEKSAEKRGRKKKADIVVVDLPI